MKKILFILIVIGCKANAQNAQKKETASHQLSVDKTPDASTYSGSAVPLVGQKSLVPVATAPLTTVSIAPPDTISSNSSRKPKK